MSSYDGADIWRNQPTNLHWSRPVEHVQLVTRGQEGIQFGAGPKRFIECQASLNIYKTAESSRRARTEVVLRNQKLRVVSI